MVKRLIRACDWYAGPQIYEASTCIVTSSEGALQAMVLPSIPGIGRKKRNKPPKTGVDLPSACLRWYLDVEKAGKIANASDGRFIGPSTNLFVVVGKSRIVRLLRLTFISIIFLAARQTSDGLSVREMNHRVAI